MNVITVRKPGDKGTRKLSKEYGNKLVCVRYRYDKKKKKRYKTIELIVEEVDWQPMPSAEEQMPLSPQRTTAIVGVQIGFREKQYQQDIKAIGGQWSPKERLWFAPEEHVIRIGLSERIKRR